MPTFAPPTIQKKGLNTMQRKYIVFVLVVTIVIAALGSAAFNYQSYRDSGITYSYHQPNWLTIERNGEVIQDTQTEYQFNSLLPIEQWTNRTVAHYIKVGDILTIDLYQAEMYLDDFSKHDWLYTFSRESRIDNLVHVTDILSLFTENSPTPLPTSGIVRLRVIGVDTGYGYATTSNLGFYTLHFAYEVELIQ